MPTELFAAGSPDVLYIVDLSSYVLRAYHAISELHSPTGEPTQAVYGTVNMLELLVRERQPALMAIAMDSGRVTFRNQIFPEYKANRPPAPQDLKQQMARCQEIVEAFAVPIFKLQGVEADDLIASAVRKAGEQRIRVVIVAADKDMMQLLSRDVIMWDTMRNRVIGPTEVEERFGVKLNQLRDLFALMGDSSDNIPGVPSIGPKTARDLLVEFGTLEGVYASLDRVSKKALRERLSEHREQAFLSQRLVTLKDDCPIQFDREALRYGGRDIQTLRRIYAELDFRRPLEALEADASSARPLPSPAEQTAATVSYRSILDAGSLEQLVSAARASGKIALDTQRCSLHRGAPLAGIALSVAPGTAYYLPLRHRYIGSPEQVSETEASRILGPLFADARIQKAAHDLKRAFVDLHSAGLSLEGFAFDTQLASYLIDPEARNDATDIAQRELDLKLMTGDELTAQGRGRHLDFDSVAIEEATRFAGARADFALRLWPRLEQRVSEAGLMELLNTLELPLARMLSDLELTGVRVDTGRLEEIGRQCEQDLKRLEEQAHRIAGRPFNVNSPRQLEALLFDELKLKPLKRTKTARSTDAATLESLADQHDLPRVILEIRQNAKLKSTYVDTLPGLIDARTGRVHTTWEQTVAATGRLSSSDPNLQNIPVRSELGRSIRAAFVAAPGHQLVSGDYSQIELRILAHLSKDPVLGEAFQRGQDVHTRTAMEIFDVDEAHVTRELRTRAKAVNFGVIYGQGDSGLAKALGISRNDAGQFIAAYFRRYQGVRQFMSETLDRARAGEAVRSLLGRRRLLPDIRSANRAKRFAAERIAMNMPIQGTAADLLKLSMLALKEPVTPGARMILTVHDELIFEVPDAEVESAKEKIRAAMGHAYPLSVPLVAEVGAGPNWNLAHS
ncbi:MAG TPA: DNA polymerase I [Polyangiaceae bacterium]|jgi:DNA polymerase-1